MKYQNTRPTPLVHGPAIAELLRRDRIFIGLGFRQDLAALDVAAILQMPAGAPYTQKSRVLAKLRETLEKIRCAVRNRGLLRLWDGIVDA